MFPQRLPSTVGRFLSWIPVDVEILVLHFCAPLVRYNILCNMQWEFTPTALLFYEIIIESRKLKYYCNINCISNSSSFSTIYTFLVTRRQQLSLPYCGLTDCGLWIVIHENTMSFVFQACMNPDNHATNTMSMARMSHALSTTTSESDPLRGAVEILEVRTCHS